ncbi:nuclear transport factor 2 family protein [bacterium]|nr:nuclear transport factor 2 family protein [bacterium]
MTTDEGSGPALPAPVLRPEDWSGEFAERVNAGNLDGAVALYAPDAHFLPPEGGEPLVGRDRIRPVLAGLIAARTRFRGRVVRAVVVGDVAVLYTDFEGTKVEASGETVGVRSRAVEVLRRRSDGGWQLIVGDPNGRGQ